MSAAIVKHGTKRTGLTGDGPLLYTTDINCPRQGRAYRSTTNPEYLPRIRKEMLDDMGCTAAGCEVQVVDLRSTRAIPVQAYSTGGRATPISDPRRITPRLSSLLRAFRV